MSSYNNSLSKNSRLSSDNKSKSTRGTDSKNQSASSGYQGSNSTTKKQSSHSYTSSSRPGSAPKQSSHSHVGSVNTKTLAGHQISSSSG